VDLQIEAVEWAIQRHKTETSDDAREARKKEIADLEALRNAIATSGKPVEARGMLGMVTPEAGNAAPRGKPPNQRL